MSQLFNTNNPGIADIGGLTLSESLFLSNLVGLSYSVGDILYIDAGGEFTNLGIGTEGQVLKVTSGFPAWGTDTGGAGSGNVDGGDADDVYLASMTLDGGSA